MADGTAGYTTSQIGGRLPTGLRLGDRAGFRAVGARWNVCVADCATCIFFFFTGKIAPHLRRMTERSPHVHLVGVGGYSYLSRDSGSAIRNPRLAA